MKKTAKKPAAKAKVAMKRAIKRPAAASKVVTKKAADVVRAFKLCGSAMTSFLQFPKLPGRSRLELEIVTFKWSDDYAIDEKACLYCSHSSAKSIGTLPAGTIVVNLSMEDSGFSGSRSWGCDKSFRRLCYSRANKRSLLLIPGEEATIDEAAAAVVEVACSQPKAQWPFDAKLLSKVRARLQKLGWQAVWAESSDAEMGGGKGHAAICNPNPCVDVFNTVRDRKKTRAITPAEDDLVVWPLPQLHLRSRDELVRGGTTDNGHRVPAGNLAKFLANRSEAHVVPQAYISRLQKEGLRFEHVGDSTYPYELWRSGRGHFTVRQLRHLLFLRYEYIDLRKLLCFGEHRYFEGLTLADYFRGQPVFEPFFGS